MPARAMTPTLIPIRTHCRSRPAATVLPNARIAETRVTRAIRTRITDGQKSENLKPDSKLTSLRLTITAPQNMIWTRSGMLRITSM